MTPSAVATTFALMMRASAVIRRLVGQAFSDLLAWMILPLLLLLFGR